jgi:phosphotransferase system HPr (HPr) family protein
MLTSSPHVNITKILVVDDYSDTAESMAQLLKLFGHDVQIARDGYQAIEIARRQRPNYVLLDIGLPGLDGYRVASTLRRELEGPLVLIAITGYGQEEDRRRALAAGFDHHLLKPVDHRALSALLAAANTGPYPSSHAGPPPEAMVCEGRPVLRVSRQVEITNTLGLHLRAADQFVRLARQFRAEVWVACDGRTANGRSILDLTTLAAACGSQLELEADGPDAEAALDALTGLIGRGFDEQDQ